MKKHIGVVLLVLTGVAMIHADDVARAEATTKLTKDTIDKKIGTWNGVIDIYAPWCGHCKFMGPRFNELAQELKGTYDFGQINSDEEPELVKRFQVQGFPTLVFIKKGKVVHTEAGAKDNESLKKSLKEHVG